MSNATELLRRALNALESMRMVELMQAGVDELPEEIRAFLAAETEAEPVYQFMVEFDTGNAWVDVDKEIFNLEGIQYSKRVLYTRPEPEADEPVAWGHPNTAITGKNQPLMMVNLEIPSNAQYPQLWVPLYLHPPRPEPARKPMTEEEIPKEWSSDDVYCYECFETGIRFAEKHHGIRGDDGE